MSKHTPGPWKFQTILTASENDRGWNIYRDHAGFGGYVGTVSPRIKGERGDASAEGLANARLIAASPLLYEACKVALGIVGFGKEHDQIAAAIKKAEEA